jgi:hypothetical protein
MTMKIRQLVPFGFLTLQSCLDEKLILNGNSTCKTPHMGKERLLQEGTLPVCVAASAQALVVARQVLDDDNNDEDVVVDDAGDACEQSVVDAVVTHASKHFAQ